jgi:hypothetical protein
MHRDDTEKSQAIFYKNQVDAYTIESGQALLRRGELKGEQFCKFIEMCLKSYQIYHRIFRKYLFRRFIKFIRTNKIFNICLNSVIIYIFSANE